MFTFQDDTTGNEIVYGPCLLKLLSDCIATNVVVGVEVLFQKLQATKLHPLPKRCQCYAHGYGRILLGYYQQQKHLKSMRLYMLNMLLSGPNTKFNAFIKQIKGDIYLGTGLNNHMLHDDLATAAGAK